MAPIRHDSQHTRGITEHELGGFREIVFSSCKLVMMATDRVWHPPTDVYETPEEVVIKMEIAGIALENLEINISDDKIVIQGKRLDMDKRTKRMFKQMEINYGNLERVIILHKNITPEKAHASYKEGFLEIVIPKTNQPSAGGTKHIKIAK